MAYPAWYRYFNTGMQPLRTVDAQRLDSLTAALVKPPASELIVHEKFSFDPNSLGAEGLARLGFESRTINQIINYRNKGGQFRIKEDLFKIYAIDSSLVINLLEYINLPEKYPHKSVSRQPSKEKDQPTEPLFSKSKALTKFDLNLADTAMLQTVKGIGTVLSRRIVSFRDKLGGFANTGQLYEVYNLDSLVIAQLLDVAYLTDSSRVRTLPVNSAKEEELAAHPYISRKQARLIVAYRNQHGEYQAPADLLKVYLLDETDLQRLQPYLHFGQLNK